jgi:hypothetical protein
VLAILKWKACTVAVVARRLSAPPENESTDFARAGSRSTAAPAGIEFGGQARLPDFCAPDLTTTRVLTCFSFSTGPPLIFRQATATVARVASFVPGLPNRKVNPDNRTGRMLTSVAPAPGLETPPLVAR